MFMNKIKALRWLASLAVLAVCVGCPSQPAAVDNSDPDESNEVASTDDPSAEDPSAEDSSEVKPEEETPVVTEPAEEEEEEEEEPAVVKPEEEKPALEPPKGPNSVLRHTVFFSFKETSSEEEVQEVVDAFRGLPAKIDSIIDFQWGVNNSPEAKADGFTHCFLLTFADDAGRKEYLPHDAHKEFGNVLRPHMEDVFVIDYWGTKQDSLPEKQLQHVVFFKFKDDAAADDVKAVEEAFAALPGKIDAIKAFEWGKNNSPEKHDDGFTHCFLVTFDSEEGRSAYLPHDAHEAFKKFLEPLEKARVLDFWAEK